jgi:Ca2+-binding EF-hand superfamily protein
MVSSISSGSSYGTEAMEAMRQSRFKKIDSDGDGKITKSEMSASQPQDGKGPSVDDIFSKVDTNQDGVIDDSEDQTAFQQMQANGPGGPPPGGPPPDASKMAADIFKSTDTDSDGKITKAELTKSLTQSGQSSSDSSKVDELFKAADTDGDGTITQAELAAYMEKMQPPPPPSQASSYSNDMSSRTNSSATGSLLSVVA